MVVDEEGEPLEGVRVWAESSWTQRGSIPETTQHSRRAGEVATTDGDGVAFICPPAPPPEPRATVAGIGNDTPWGLGMPLGRRTFVAERPGWPRASSSEETITLGPPRDVWLEVETRCAPGGYTLSVGSFDSPDNPTVLESEEGRTRVSGLGPFEYIAVARCCGSETTVIFDGAAEGPVSVATTARTVTTQEHAGRPFEITTAGDRPVSVAFGRFDAEGQAPVELPETGLLCARVQLEGACGVGRFTRYRGMGTAAQISALDLPGTEETCSPCTTAVEADPLPVSTAAVRSLELGAKASCAIVEDGTLQCWGGNGDRVLGDGTGMDQPSPVTTPGLSDLRQVAVGRSHACALHGAGVLSCWGTGYDGRLGTGSTSPTSSARRVSVADPVALDVGSAHSCAVTKRGEVYCWGGNILGQLGVGDLDERHTPARVHGLSNARDVIAGPQHTCALLDDGATRCWGSNRYGELGVKAGAARTRPVTPKGAPAFDELALMSRKTCGRAGDEVWCWGVDGSAPRRLETPRGVRSIAAGGFLCVLDDKGVVSCDAQRRKVFLPVEGLTDIAQFDVGEGHVCGLKSDGTTVCWGANEHGQLGTGGCE